MKQASPKKTSAKKTKKPRSPKKTKKSSSRKRTKAAGVSTASKKAKSSKSSEKAKRKLAEINRVRKEAEWLFGASSSEEDETDEATDEVIQIAYIYFSVHCVEYLQNLCNKSFHQPKCAMPSI